MIKFSFNYLKNMKFKLFMYVILSIITSLITIIVPLLIGRMIDSITEYKNIHTLIFICFIFLSLQVICTIIQYFSNKLYIIIQTNSAFNMNKDIIQHLHKVSLQLLDKYNMVYMNDRINTDSNEVIIFVLNMCVQVITNILKLFLASIILIQINKYIYVVSLILCLLYAILYLSCKNKIFNMSLLFKENQARFFAILLEQLKNVRFIRRHSLNDVFIRRLIKSFQFFFKDVVKSQKFMYLYSSMESVISFVAQGLIYLLAGISVIKGNMTIGTFTIAYSYYQYISASINYFSGLGKSYQGAYASYKRISELNEVQELEDGQIILESIDYIECKNLKFMRENTLIIDDFSYLFKKGYVYCLVGANGAGKTTLIDLMLGIYLREYDGVISYNGHTIKQLSMHYLRFNNISVMEQFSYFTKDNIQENIFLTNQHSQSLCNVFLKRFEINNCEDFIFSSSSNNDSTLLSGGEAQKVAFLRLICKNADVMILDEPTASVDAVSKQIMLKYLKEIAEKKIIIVVTHDKEIIDYCDDIIHL